MSEQTTPEGAVMMDRLVTLTYQDKLPPSTVRFADALLDGRLLGQKCPVCSRVYMPPKGYCPLDVVLLGPETDIEVSDQGTVTGFTIITPVRYYGQTKTEPFVYASVLLDGASGTLPGQDITGLPIDQVHAGLRVKAMWKPKAERSPEGHGVRGGGSVEGSITGFEPTGEPDADPSHYLEHII